MTTWVGVIQPFLQASSRLVFWTASALASGENTALSLSVRGGLAHFVLSAKDEPPGAEPYNAEKRREARSYCLWSRANLTLAPYTLPTQIRVRRLLGAGWVSWYGLYRHGFLIATEDDAQLWILLPFLEDEAYVGADLSQVEIISANESVRSSLFVCSTSSDVLRTPAWCQITRTITADGGECYQAAVDRRILLSGFDLLPTASTRSDSQLHRPLSQALTERARSPEGAQHARDGEPIIQDRSCGADERASHGLAGALACTGVEALRQQLRRRVEAEIEAWIESKTSLMGKETLARRVSSRFALLDSMEPDPALAHHHATSMRADGTSDLPGRESHGLTQQLSATRNVAPGAMATDRTDGEIALPVDRSHLASSARQPLRAIDMDARGKAVSDASISEQDAVSQDRSARNKVASETAHRLQTSQEDVNLGRNKSDPVPVRLEIIQQQQVWSLDRWHALVRLGLNSAQFSEQRAPSNTKPWRLVAAAPLENVDFSLNGMPVFASLTQNDYLFEISAPAHQVHGRCLNLALVTAPPNARCFPVGSIRVPEDVTDSLEAASAPTFGSESLLSVNDCYEIVLFYPLGMFCPEINLSHWWRRSRQHVLEASPPFEVRALIEPALAYLALWPRAQQLGPSSSPAMDRRYMEALLKPIVRRIRASLPAGASIVATGRVTLSLRLLDALEYHLQSLGVSQLAIRPCCHGPQVPPETSRSSKGTEQIASVFTEQQIIHADVLMALLQETLAFTVYAETGH